LPQWKLAACADPDDKPPPNTSNVSVTVPAARLALNNFVFNLPDLVIPAPVDPSLKLHKLESLP
jgi:hypothetical protein